MCAVMATSAWAIPALPQPETMTQSDGSTITIQLHGDEFYNFTATTDGYVVVTNEKGDYVYATTVGNDLVPSAVMAHDPAQRPATETAFLAEQGVRQLPAAQRERAREMRRAMSKRLRAPRRADADSVMRMSVPVVLINFTDRTFSMGDPQAFYAAMYNQEGFTGYYNSDSTFVECTGSLRDYFVDNSMGQFVPTFDVLPPVTVDTTANAMNDDDAREYFMEALAELGEMVDFAKYDTDGDSCVDAVCFLVAGYTSSYTGNNSGYLWPHMWTIPSTFNVNGISFYKYASSCEIYGPEKSPANCYVAGIGTMTHEFCHVLGMPDLYDTDGSTSGSSHTPLTWDVMATGSYNNSQRTPAGLSAFERLYVGSPDLLAIESIESCELPPLNESNMAYYMESPNEDEFFIFENRQLTKWDTYLTYHGMLAYRLDQSNDSVWAYSRVNANASRNYYEMLRAAMKPFGVSVSDPFPGSSHVPRLTPYTTPSLTTWDGKPAAWGLHHIAESADGIITFDVVKGDTVEPTIIEDFELMAANSKMTNTTMQQGNFATWDFTRSYVTDRREDCRNGERSAAMIVRGNFEMNTPVAYDSIYLVSLDVYNPASEARFALYYSTNHGVDYVPAIAEPMVVWAGLYFKILWPVSITEPVQFRVEMTKGSSNKTAPTYVDDFTIYHNGKPYSGLVGDVNLDGVVDSSDIACIVDIITGATPAGSYGTRDDVNADNLVDATDISAIANIIASQE